MSPVIERDAQYDEPEAH